MNNIELMELKINIAHRALHNRIRRSIFGYDDGGWHNIRAMLINRVEQDSDYMLRVDLDGADPNSIAKILPEKEYFVHKYGKTKEQIIEEDLEKCSDG